MEPWIWIVLAIVVLALVVLALVGVGKKKRDH
ncbi:LPXTG cell wall anchor domain-containing protein [Kocuria sp. CNJ-770]|nr:LPXTG cell wall anchor domain-containing protein [Kocuria sp. CNJ-770]